MSFELLSIKLWVLSSTPIRVCPSSFIYILLHRRLDSRSFFVSFFFFYAREKNLDAPAETVKYVMWVVAIQYNLEEILRAKGGKKSPIGFFCFLFITFACKLFIIAWYKHFDYNNNGADRFFFFYYYTERRFFSVLTRDGFINKTKCSRHIRLKSKILRRRARVTNRVAEKYRCNK